MDALPQHARAVWRIEMREYTGSGMRFCNGDTLIARITPCLENGKTAYVSGLRDGEVGHGSTEYIVLSGRPGESDSLFGYYLARSPDFRRYAIGHMEGTSGRQRVPSSAIERFPITLPPISEQRAIAHILGTLDDKIELNRRMSETLEAMARALFKAWFVDFEPVRAKMEGRWRRGETLPGLPAHLYDLFPDRLVESELGEIPEGWEVTAIDGEFDVTMGQSPPGSTYNETGDGLPFYQGRADFEFRFPKRRVYCTAPTRFAKKGDTLVSVRAPVGDINMASEDCAIGRGVAAVRHKTGCRSYTYQFMNSISDVFARFDSEGTVFGSIGKKDFHAITHVRPSHDLVLAYEGLAAPLDDQIERNERESRYLAQLRDTLLPKLISGELRVPDVDKFMEAMA
jgi:type I restriction enzyme S subunit